MFNINKLAIEMAVVVIMTSCTSENQKTDTDAPPEIDVAEVMVDSVMVHHEYPGYLTADREVDVVARVSGFLESKPYEAGTRVQAGTVLFTIDSKNYVDAVNQAHAKLDDARAQCDYNVKNYDAMTRAYAGDAVSQMEVLQANSAVKTSLAAIDEAAAALRSAETTLGYCTIRAPFDGRVSVCNYTPGAFLDGSATPVTLCRVYDDRLMVANFAVDDSQYQNLLNNKTIQAGLACIPLKFDEPLNATYTARLSYLSPDVSRSTGTVNLQAHIENPDGELKSGMFVRLLLPSEVLEHATLVSDDAIAMSQIGHYMFVVDSLNRVVMTPVEVGETVRDTLRVITKGVKPGDRYVTKALLKVRDGMKITPRLTN